MQKTYCTKREGDNEPKHKHSPSMNFNAYIKLTRLHRPVGIGLLLFPAWWGIALASSSWPFPYLLALFALGAILMRSAGCVYNDMIDKNFDVQVARTAARPLATGIVSTKEAYSILLTLLACSALILFSLPPSVILTGFVALALVFLYPWMKRITYWPQLFLGFTFNIGILMGWLSLQPTLSLTPFIFYAGAIFWTLGYDTLYAYQDMEDDLLAGVKSSTMAISPAPKLWLSLFYASALILWGIGGQMAQLGWIYILVLSLIFFHFTWQILSLKREDPSNCLKRFVSNTQVGLLLFIGIVFSRVIN